MAPSRWSTAAVTALLLAASPLANAQYYKIGTPAEIKESARTIAYDLMTLYKGNQSGETPGILPGPPSEGKGDYYWWQGGALMGTLIDYWKLTGDSSYNQVVMQGMLHQVGDNKDYQPLNHTASLGNDDQGFWGMSAMLAAENKFPNPPEDKPQWLALAQAVFNTQAAPDRHDDTCGGGLRWQIPRTNNGYDYKNTVANACFFNLAARLARYTRNDTYTNWAERQWDWIYGVNYIDKETWQVYDGGHIPFNCTDINKQTFSYNAALLIHGSAFMWNLTQEEKWVGRINSLTDSLLKHFFPEGIAYEPTCEHGQGNCTPDMISFKGYVHRWMAVATQLAPFLRPKILPVLESSTKACVKQCVGGPSGRKCGFYWSTGQFFDPSIDKTTGAGEHMDALAAVSSLLIENVDPPVDNTTGISMGDPLAGTGPKSEPLGPITTGDRAGAGILTALILGGAVGTWSWMSLGQ